MIKVRDLHSVGCIQFSHEVHAPERLLRSIADWIEEHQTKPLAINYKNDDDGGFMEWFDCHYEL